MDRRLEFCVHSSKYRQLLCDLKNTIEGLLVTQVANVWTIYGGLNRLHNIMSKIFKHGCKTSENRDAMKKHRRCASFPDNYMKKVYEEKALKNVSTDISDGRDQKIVSTKACIQGKFKPWRSMPCLHTYFEREFQGARSKTLPNTPVHNVKTETEFQSSKSKGGTLHKKCPKVKERNRIIFNNLAIVEHTPPQSVDDTSKEDLTPTNISPRKSGLSTSPLQVVESFLPKSGEKDYKKLPKKSFIEDGGMSVLPMSTGYFPKPAKGQSLLSFLCSSQLNRTNAELDRENAHFSISEAIISAVEQIRCKHGLKEMDEQIDDSDPEILDLKQKIRLRRTAKVMEKHRKAWASAKASDLKSDTTTTASPLSTSSNSSPTNSCTSLSSLAFDDDLGDAHLEQSLCTLSSNRSASTTTLCSELDLSRSLSWSTTCPLPPRGAPDGAASSCDSMPVDVSAEGVAISLIRKFSDKQLPKASDVEWLVSEEDAPQALLPLPKSWPVSPDSGEENTTPLRGTLEWAPPRPQIIFTPHPRPRRKDLIANQNYRCAGCSMKVSAKYAVKFRYCEYLGRYFCTGCHTNQLALIPGKVLQKWDFRRYPVSTFSYRLLEQMYTDPLFHVLELNKNITKMSKHLLICNQYRQALYYLKDFIFSCKYAENIKERLEQERSYLLTDPGVYSLNDLMNVKTGVMKEQLGLLFQTCCKHTVECKICLGRGFICEICNKDEIIFPWQLKSVARCSRCGSCYHSRCWNPTKDSCRKCLRLQKKKEANLT
ncbi:unnamed protein product [Acanthoscelides obtectus]|uniref:Phorbol-ester/DAG-type domain-containing protein n=1 Tax=Acanthoscelides obtectus TaxID=200917 RepID=A0A9P0LB63_ACAOB|nr:unnamed protein product [Acanthoscelides obtectus]CAK1629559.1 Run domain Beclin-1-interacting and cysteine-rich domain-containing protein [Acanthoscelides obtectus]